MSRLTVVGGGRIGTAIASALHDGGDVEVSVLCRRPEHADTLTETLGLTAGVDPTVVAYADAVLYAVKPQDMPAAAAGTRDTLPTQSLVISVATGLATATIGELLGRDQGICRAVTTTAAEIGRAVSVLTTDGLTPGQRRLADSIFAAVGTVRHLPESMMDAASVIAGGSGAYTYFLTEVLTHAAVSIGLSAAVGRDLVTAAMVGAAAMLEQHPERHPATMREDVMSRGGTTIAAFHLLEGRGVRGDLMDAVQAAYRRCLELAELASTSAGQQLDDSDVSPRPTRAVPQRNTRRPQHRIGESS